MALDAAYCRSQPIDAALTRTSAEREARFLAQYGERVWLESRRVRRDCPLLQLQVRADQS
jgi:hypothetical protein